MRVAHNQTGVGLIEDPGSRPFQREKTSGQRHFDVADIWKLLQKLLV
jgi:hypothetical protein